ncbi:hypothetical protein [Sutcliffiella cohnii]|uniref:hypothetical protein n=1 Tax=Sutcliffiella cohnii TaxID=33932 RepID=UPI002E226CBE|nr:hypothetical protein [Sutcliffiella cohnii]
MNKNEFHLLKVYLYDTKQLRLFFYDMLHIVRKEVVEITDCMIQKNWVKGPHIALYFKILGEKNEKEVLAKLESCIQEKLSSFENSVTNADYEKYEQLSQRLARAERYPGDLVPLKENKTIDYSLFNLADIKTVYDVSLYREIEVAKTKFFLEHYPLLKKMTEEEKELLSTKLMLIVANQYFIEFDQEVLKGIKYGYMSFKSHYEGFNMQLLRMDPSKRTLIEQKINEQSDLMQQFLADFGSFVQQIDDSFIQYYENDKALLVEWKNVTSRLDELFKEGLQNKQIQFEEYHDISSFVQSSNKMSEFHNEFVDGDGFSQFSKSIGFLKYRLLVNFLYSVFPLLNISPLQKNKLCKIISDASESYFQFSWKDLKALRGDTYDGDDIYEKIGTKRS